MRKIIIIILCIFTTTNLYGCSNSIIDKYPNIEKDFIKSDYEELKELSEGETIEYSELCQKWINRNIDENDLKILNRIISLSKQSSFDIKRTNNMLTITYRLTFEDIMKLGVGDMHSTIIFTFAENNLFELKSISFDNKELQRVQERSIIEAIEKSEDIALNVLNSVEDETRINNNIYITSQNYYYLPIKNNTITMFTSLSDVPKEYINITEHYDNVLDDFDKQIDELEESLKRTEELY